MNLASATPATIGVFDSGVGGLSVLRALRDRLPRASLHYLADSAWAPYGDRSVEEVSARSQRMVEHLLDHGASMVVVACNTATTAAIGMLRARWPALPFVGVEPGVKPAVARSRNGRIGVLATRRTIASERLRALVAEHAAGREVHLQACPGLVDAIEGGTLDDAELDALIRGYCSPLVDAQVDTVVLGCTHYPFVAQRLQAVLGPQVMLVNTADAVAERARSLWQGSDPGPARLRLQTTGDAQLLGDFARRWLTPQASAEHVEL